MDVLKIDQAFVHHLHEQPQLEAICRAIVVWATASAWKWWPKASKTTRSARPKLSMGCDTGQGFGLARPMPAGDFVSWLKQWCDRQRPRAGA